MKAWTKDGKPWFRVAQEMRDERVERIVAEVCWVKDGRAELRKQTGLGWAWQCLMGTVCE